MTVQITPGGGRVVQRCWVNFQCRGVLLTWIIIGHGPIALAKGVGGVVWTFFSCLSFLFSYLPLWETARYRLKYCLKGLLNPKQPINHTTSEETVKMRGHNVCFYAELTKIISNYCQIFPLIWSSVKEKRDQLNQVCP